MSSEIEALYKQAEKAEESHDFEAALAHYETIIQKTPEEDHAYYSLANIYAIRGLVSQVVNQYLKLADVLETKGQLDGAIEVCQWVISIEPAGVQVRPKLITFLEKQSRNSEALEQSILLARIYASLGHWDQAVELLQKQVGLYPDNMELLFQLGEIYIKQGQIQEGITLYKNIAKELLKRQDFNRAVDALKRIKALRNNDLDNLAALGGLYIQLGKLEEAKAEFRLILREDLSHIDALSQLGLIAKMQGAWEEARLPFRKIVELDPGNAFGQEGLAEVNEVLGNSAEAIKRYLAAADLYEKKSNKEKAIEIFQNILALDSAQAVALERLKALNGFAIAKKRITKIGAADRSFPKPFARPSGEEEKATPVSETREDTPRGSKESEKKFASFQVAASKTSAPLDASEKEQKPGQVPAKKSILTRLRNQIAPSKTPATHALSEPLQPHKASTPPATSDKVQEVKSAAKEEEVKSRDEVPVQAAPKAIPVVETLKAVDRPAENVTPVAVNASEPEVATVPKAAIPEVLSPAVQASPVTLPSDLEKDVQQLVAQGQVDAAIRLCMETLKETPGDRATRALLGKVYSENGFLKEAVECLKELVDGTPDAKVLGMLSELYLFLGQGDAWLESSLAQARMDYAERNMDRAAELVARILGWNSSHLEARRLMISIFKEQGSQSLALYHLRLLAESVEMSNAPGDLIPIYQELLELKPSAFSVRYKLALCYQELGKIDEAKQQFVLLSTYFGAQGQMDKEEEYLERAHSLDQADEGIVQRLRDVNRCLGRPHISRRLAIELGDLSARKGDVDVALGYYQEVLEADPKNVACLSRAMALFIQKNDLGQALKMGKCLGDMYVEAGENDKAISLYEDLLRTSPEELFLHRCLAELYLHGNQEKKAAQEFMALAHLAENKALFDDAIDAYHQVLALDGANKDARYQMAVILADHKNNWEAALTEFKKVKGLDPHHVATVYRLAKGYAAQDNIEAALQYVHDLTLLDSAHKELVQEFSADLEARFQKEPENFELHFNYGILCKEAGNLDNAIKEFQIVMRKYLKLALRAYAYQGLCWEEKAIQLKEEALFQTAIKVYKKGLDLKGYKDEEYLELKHLLAKLYELLGQVQEAIALYQEIIVVDIDYKDARAKKKQLAAELSSGKVTRLPSSR